MSQNLANQTNTHTSLKSSQGIQQSSHSIVTYTQNNQLSPNRLETHLRSENPHYAAQKLSSCSAEVHQKKLNKEKDDKPMQVKSNPNQSIDNEKKQVIQPTQLNKKVHFSSQQFHKGQIILNQKKNIKYRAIELIGTGTFGKVLQVIRQITHSQRVSSAYMALKITKNQAAYINQGIVEVKHLKKILQFEQMIQQNTKNNFVKIYDCFVWNESLCTAFQLLDNSILNILQTSNYKGLEMKWIQKWAKQILLSLAKIHCIGIVHCDIKPQNIMFRPEEPEKPLLIDFNSSFSQENNQLFTYIQSRYYRSPEVIIGLLPYTQKIDIWSLGCVLAEMYIGLPIFPGANSYDQISKIYRMIKNSIDQNSVGLIKESKGGQSYFQLLIEKSEEQMSENKQKQIKGVAEHENSHYFCSKYIRLKNIEDYQRENNYKIQRNEDYINIESLDNLLDVRNPSPKDIQTHQLFLDLIKKMLVFNPEDRISAQNAFLHPFIGGTFSELEPIFRIQQILAKKNGTQNIE